MVSVPDCGVRGHMCEILSEITKMLIAVLINKFTVLFIIIFGILSFPICKTQHHGAVNLLSAEFAVVRKSALVN